MDTAKNADPHKSGPLVCHGGRSLLAIDACTKEGDPKEPYGTALPGSSDGRSCPEGFATKEKILPAPGTCWSRPDASLVFVPWTVNCPPFEEDTNVCHVPYDTNVKTIYWPLNESRSLPSAHLGRDPPKTKDK